MEHLVELTLLEIDITISNLSTNKVYSKKTRSIEKFLLDIKDKKKYLCKSKDIRPTEEEIETFILGLLDSEELKIKPQINKEKYDLGLIIADLEVYSHIELYHLHLPSPNEEENFLISLNLKPIEKEDSYFLNVFSLKILESKEKFFFDLSPKEKFLTSKISIIRDYIKESIEDNKEEN